MTRAKVMCLVGLLAALAGCPDDFGFDAIRSPQVDEIDPATGPTRGGQLVTITGENFIENTKILFDKKPCLDLEIASETEITCRTPVHDAGEAKVSATHDELGTGDRTATYTFEPPPKFSLEPGDTVGYTKLNINYCLESTCVPENEIEAAWKSTYIISEDGVQISEDTGEWEVRAKYYHEVTEGVASPEDAAPLLSAWLHSFGPFDQAAGYTDSGEGTFTTSMPPIPLSDTLSFPFFDLEHNWEAGEQSFRDYVLGIDPEAKFKNQIASRRLEAYFVDQDTPPKVHHVWIIFHSVGIVCSVDEEVAEVTGEVTRTQSDFTDVVITPKSNVSFAFVQRLGGSKQYCSCAADTGCE